MNEKLEKNENKKTADVLRAENLVRDYVQYGEDGEKKKEIHVLKGLNFSELWEDPDVERRHF